MKLRKRLCRIVFFSSLFCVLILPSITSAAETPDNARSDRPWSVAVETKYFFHSHTSYEFGNPVFPYQSPLSRLEFPLNSWWIGAFARRDFTRFSVGLEGLRNLSREPGGRMADSDWEDDNRPYLKTIYSESSCRMDPSYIVRGDVDLKIADWLGLPGRLDLRPLVGVMWQRFSLVTQNGVQYALDINNNVSTTPLPGEGIRFEQTYWHIFTGLKAALDLGKPFDLAHITVQTQADGSYVIAKNEDWHLLRAGKRLTYEDTTGYAWHLSANLKIGWTENLNTNFGVEYLCLATRGSHRMVNELFGLDIRFDNGVRVWSEQTNLTLGLEYRF